MRRTTLVVIAAVCLGVGTARAQESVGAGRVEIGGFPGGGMVFTSSSTSAEPDFTNFAVGGSLTFNFNQWIGIEGEAGQAPGRHQLINYNGQTLTDQHTPCMVVYNANVVVSPFGNKRAFVPYATGGAGGLTMLNIDEANLGVTENTTYPTASVGGGVKWFAARHFGVRADYRMFVLKNKDTAPAFFGREENRQGHRVYGGVLLTF